MILKENSDQIRLDLQETKEQLKKTLENNLGWQQKVDEVTRECEKLRFDMVIEELTRSFTENYSLISFSNPKRCKMKVRFRN